MYNIKKGLDLPITGRAKGSVESVSTAKVAVLGPDYLGMKPTMLVQQGDRVHKGQKLFEDKKNPGVFFTAPISGVISAVNRGDKRMLLSVVIERDDSIETVKFSAYNSEALVELERQTVVDNLLASGMWASLRTRPYSKTPAVDAIPNSIFVTATDSNPLAINPEMVINDRQSDFESGLLVVSKLTEGKTFVCKRAGSNIETGQANVEVAEFDGLHPSGLVGTHIHYLDPVNAQKSVWHLNYQDVIAIGALFLSGELDSSRVISIAGPAAKNPKFVKTEVGASIAELTADQGISDEIRVVNGSVFAGRTVGENTDFLSKYALQLSLLQEGTKKEFIGYMLPGSNKFTVTRAFLGGLSSKLFDFTTTSNGSPRSMVPIGVYEKVMPLDILPTLLLKALLVKDTDGAQELGVLELDEEDLALCTFVCPSKYEYGAILRENLEQIERDG